MRAGQALLGLVVVALFCAAVAGGRAHSARADRMGGTAAPAVPLSVSVETGPGAPDPLAGSAPEPAPLPAGQPAVARLPVPAPPLPERAPRLREPAPPARRTVRALVTAYCPCRRCCGRFADGRTSTDTTAWRPGIAADPTVLPYGTVVEVPGYGTHPVDDTGGAMRRHWRRDGILHIDVRMTYHWQARQWGRREMDITLLAPAE